MHAAKCVLDLNRNDFADSLDFDMNLKTNPTDMNQIGAYTKQSHTKESETSKKGSKNSPIKTVQNHLNFLGVIKDQRAKLGTIIRMITTGLMV